MANLHSILTVPAEVVERGIYLIRGEKVMIGSDLAELYQVATGNLNLAVRRSAKGFPPDFMFQLTKERFEKLILRSARSSWGGRRRRPYVFTGHEVRVT